MKRKSGCRWLFICIALVMGFSASPLHAETIGLNYSIFFPSSHAQCQAGVDWAQTIEEDTGGAVSITVFPGGTLTSAKQTFDGVVKGIADIGMSCFAYTRGRFPVMEAADLPLGYPDGLTATRVVNNFYEEIAPEELAGVKVLYLHAHGPGLLHTKKPVASLQDLKNMKIRSTGLSAKVVEALGGVPVAMSQGATYESLKKGVVEGTFGPMEVLKGWRQAEVVEATTECFSVGYTTTMFVVMNRDKWQSLPAAVQEIFTAVSKEWIDVHGRTWDEADQEGREYTLGKGNTIIPLSDEQSDLWKRQARPVIEHYIADAAERGLSGETYVEILRQGIQHYKKQ